MFCPECGSKNVDEAVFCENCGSKIIDNTSQQVIQSKQDQFTATHTQTTPTQTASPFTAPTQTTLTQATPTQATPTQATPTQAQVQFIPTPRKPMSKKSKITLAIVILIFVAFTTLYQVGKYLSNPNRLASKYFEDLMSGNWEEVYNYYELPKSEFLSKENFLDIKKKEEIENLANYKVTSNSNETKEEKELVKTVNIEYLLQGDTSTNSYEVKLIKQKEKNFLFFNKWKISPDNVIITDYTLDVPKDTEVRFDNIKVSEKYLNPSDDENLDTYTIDPIFMGVHKIKLTHDIMKDYAENVSIYDNTNGFYFDAMELKDDIQESLANKSIDILQTFYTSAIDEKNFSDISNSISMVSDTQSDLEDVYTNLQNSINNNDDGTGLQNITFDNFNYTTEYSYYDEYPQLIVNLDYNYQCDYTTSDWWTGEIESYTNDGSDQSSYTFEYIDGEWKLYYIYLYPIYY